MFDIRGSGCLNIFLITEFLPYLAKPDKRRMFVETSTLTSL
jgi:hypothetical protein